MKDLVTIGEILIDLTYSGRQNGVPVYVANPGGAPANVAVAAARLGADSAFIGKRLNPAPFRLPARTGLQVYDRSGGMETFGIFEDSLPDGWGRRLVDASFRKRKGRLPTVLERLACVGLSGMGALAYEPADETLPPPERFDLAALASNAMEFDAGMAEDVLPEIRRAGGSSGGARPKAFIGYNPATGEACAEREDLPTGFEHWIVKFNTRADGEHAGENEFRWHQAAIAAGAKMAPCRLIAPAFLHSGRTPPCQLPHPRRGVPHALPADGRVDARLFGQDRAFSQGGAECVRAQPR